ncbi:MAG: hypothetical protein ACLR1T_02505 [Evtepia gabavorous]
MQVKKNTLLLLACLVWTAAGVNILRIGLLAYATQVSLPTSCSPFWSFFSFRSLSSAAWWENTPDGSWDIGRTDSSSSAFLTRSPFSSWPG